MTGLTLTAGNYEKQAVMVDSVEVAMYLFEGHDYFTEGHPLSKQQVCAIVAEEKNRYEVDRGMDYPFTRYVLVETPVQFDAWDRPWETHVESIQPQMALVPELGYYQTSLSKRYLSVSWYYSTGGMDDKEQRAKDMIRNIVSNTLMSDQRQRTVARETRSRNYKPIDNTWLQTSGTYRVPGYPFSAHFYPFLVSFESDRYPIFNAVMEFQRKHGFLNESRSSYRMDHPLLETEIACTWLDSCSVAEYLENGADFDTLNQLLIVKSNQLFGTIQAASGGTGFDMFLNEFITDHTFESVSYDEFADAANARFGIDMDRIFEGWYNQQGLPMFETSDISLTEVIDGEYTLYQTMLTLTNTEPVTGTVVLELGRTDNIDIENGTRFVTLDGHQSKQIAFLTDSPPPHLTVDCLVAKNLPLKLTRHLGTPAVDHRAEPFEGERVVPYSPSMAEPGTIVVDNLDAGFEIVSEAENAGDHSYGSIWESFEKVPGDFDPPLFRMPLKRWSKAVFNSSYGQQSIAFFTQGGVGDGAVAWHADIPEPGTYDLEYYFLNTEVEDLNRYNPFGPARSVPFLVDYNLTVSYADTDDSIEFMPVESRPGWQYVATFDLEPGQVDVVLSNKSDGMLVYADAIRWVKK